MTSPESAPRLLLVDDDPLIIELLEMRLKKQGFNIKTAFDGQQAYDVCGEFLPHLIVCDVVMPRMDGLTFCKRLRAEGNPVPFLFLTAKGLPKEKVEMLSAGADDYVVKPFNPQELQARIASILRRPPPGNT